ncbi:MAG: RNA polymerase sigma factor, RpoD/SigA family [Okeania sp. SIO3C4]|nr:RNA polymerase sigma factor, RpoD/SigA family [Okeania sp. SIO3C4]
MSTLNQEKKKTQKINKSSSRSYSSMDTVRTYLHEIGRVPLLTREEEIVYGKKVKYMMELLESKEKLEEKLGRAATQQEWAEYVQLSEEALNQIINHGRRAKQKMIEANLRLVVAIAKKYQKRNMEFLDLIQEGTLGLERGVEKFDPMRGYKFSTYAYWWIRQAITRAIAQQARTIRLPIHITEKLNKIKRVQRELIQSLGRTPTPSEIAQALELEPSQIREYLLMARHPISLDLRVGDNQDTELQELLEDEASSPDDYITRELLRQDLNTLLGELTDQQRRVLTLRFGLEDGREMSLAKVGERLQLSRERVRQLEHQALAHLRRRQAKVREYVAS